MHGAIGAVLATVTLSVVLLTAQARQLHIRDGGVLTHSSSAPTCKNTIQGMHFVTDSSGFHCPREQLNYQTGCCSSGQQFSCAGCLETDQCCEEFELCVSCCMEPKHIAAAKEAGASRSRRMRGSWDSDFAFCASMCRSHSKSTVHENAYISNRHHCFSELGRPFVSDPLPQGALNGVTLTVSKQGESCDTACRAIRRSCSESHLNNANSCDRLREHVGCEAGCEPLTDSNAVWAPAYVVSNAPKQNRPAMCFLSRPGAALGCGAKDKLAQRLCTCV
mmetsp:Transcript_57625/g.117299  ORF Transcript_57625/g.117299 Transcript_57625/m.117299 type:complete len:277 (-) Transcript_57625:9-839(-)